LILKTNLVTGHIHKTFELRWAYHSEKSGHTKKTFMLLEAMGISFTLKQTLKDATYKYK